MKVPENLNPDELERLLSYNPQTGELRWKRTISRFNKRGGVAGRTYNSSKGEVEVKINGRWYKAHHIAWYFITGLWPRTPISHRDNDYSNNSKDNLYERFSIIRK